MKFEELLISAVQRSEIPLRFEPGAEESVAKPVIEVLRAWIGARISDEARTEFEKGRQSLAVELMAELDGADLPE